TTTRRSPGRPWRSTSPAATSRSTRLVMVPDETSVWDIRTPGVSSYGAPARRSAESTSKDHGSRPREVNAARLASSRCRASREIRENSCSGAGSRSGRSRRQASTILSTSSSMKVEGTGGSVHGGHMVLHSDAFFDGDQKTGLLLRDAREGELATFVSFVL